MKGRRVPPAYTIIHTESIGYQVVFVDSGKPLTKIGYATKREALAAVLGVLNALSYRESQP